MSQKPFVYYIGQDPSIILALHQTQEFIVRNFSTLSEFLSANASRARGCALVEMHPTSLVEASLGLFSRQLLLPTIVLSGAPNVRLAVRAMKNGAADFLGKPVADATLVAAVRGALSANGATLERARHMDALRSRVAGLSSREREVVDAVLEGRANKEIAALLGISHRTVETHRSKAMSKLGARTSADLVRAWLDFEWTSKMPAPADSRSFSNDSMRD